MEIIRHEQTIALTPEELELAYQEAHYAKMEKKAVAAYCSHVNLTLIEHNSKEREAFHSVYGFDPQDGCNPESEHYLAPRIIDKFADGLLTTGDTYAAWDAAVEEVLDSLASTIKIPVDSFFDFINENYVLSDTTESLIKNCILYAKCNASDDENLQYLLGILLRDPIEEQDINRVVFNA